MHLAANLSTAILAHAKWAFTTRRVNRDDVAHLRSDMGAALAGDLLLCEILAIGQHKKIQLASRRASTSYPGDLVVLCLGDRYAPDQYMAAASVRSETLSLVLAAVSRAQSRRCTTKWTSRRRCARSRAFAPGAERRSTWRIMRCPIARRPRMCP